MQHAFMRVQGGFLLYQKMCSLCKKLSNTLKFQGLQGFNSCDLCVVISVKLVYNIICVILFICRHRVKIYSRGVMTPFR